MSTRRIRQDIGNSSESKEFAWWPGEWQRRRRLISGMRERLQTKRYHPIGHVIHYLQYNLAPMDCSALNTAEVNGLFLEFHR